MSEIAVDEYYKRQAKEQTDMLFDKGFLNPDLTRGSIDWLQDYLGFLLQSTAQSAAKCERLTATMRGLQK